MSKLSKRMAFAHAAKLRRKIARVQKANCHKPGFVGVITRLVIRPVGGGPAEYVSHGLGAIFMGVQYRASP